MSTKHTRRAQRRHDHAQVVRVQYWKETRRFGPAPQASRRQELGDAARKTAAKRQPADKGLKIQPAIFTSDCLQKKAMSFLS